MTGMGDTDPLRAPRHCQTCTCGCTCGDSGHHDPGNSACDVSIEVERRRQVAAERIGAWTDPMWREETP